MPQGRTAVIRGARANNLKAVDVDLPLGQLVIITGPSGSGKSSLAFDTLHAEGQRRYVETFSAYTRQFLERLDKPVADRLDGIPPSIAVGQRLVRRSARSTVGTITGIHDALGLLFAKVGVVHCRLCGARVQPSDPEDVARAIDAMPAKTPYLIAYPVNLTPDTDMEALAEALRADGFSRARVDGVIQSIASDPIPATGDSTIDVVVDRQVRGAGSEVRRLDSIETAFSRGFGRCRIITDGSAKTFFRGWVCSVCGTEARAPEPRLFRYNSPLGACPTCEGTGTVAEIDLTKVVPDPSLSLRAGAIAPWAAGEHRLWNDRLAVAAADGSIDLDRPFADLPADQLAVVVEGNDRFPGLRGFFRQLERKSSRSSVRELLSRSQVEVRCGACAGTRLRPAALAVKLADYNIAGLSALTISQTLRILDRIDSSATSARILAAPRERLGYLERIGLGYLTLDRAARTLSTGESRRVGLTSALGSGLVNTLYVLDEPSIGLHPRDIEPLLESMRRLRDSGNSLAVVEHDESIILAADYIIEIGPGAGEAGGRIVFSGPVGAIGAVEESPTGRVLSGRASVNVPLARRRADLGWIRIRGADGHNLRSIDVDIPLGRIVCVTGVSGAGKSTLVAETLYPALVQRLRGDASRGEPFAEISGHESLRDVQLIDQSPIGRSPRSNPITFLGAFDEIRKTFAQQHESKIRNYRPSRFSFNVSGGRCDRCEGNGELTIDMQFLADVTIRCPECKGTRYRPEILDVKYRGKNVAEVLALTAREAFGFFRHKPKVQARLHPLLDVGLDYLRLGQPATTLSGGEAQRLKLAASLASTPAAITRAASKDKSLYLFDEPTSGLHAVDIDKLLSCFHSLADQGHTPVIVEHNSRVWLASDWIIDLGPGAGDEGGRIVAVGTPEAVAATDTPTGEVLARELKKWRRHPDPALP